MRQQDEDGRLQVTAGLSLLDRSGLVEWRPDRSQFHPVGQAAFDDYWRSSIDPVFGRLMCWLCFSAGAEFLGKGVCLINGVEIRKDQEVPIYPTTDLDRWVSEYLKDWKNPGTVTVAHFGTLGSLQPALVKLCGAVLGGNAEKERLLATYDLLGRAIRNRDAHAYVTNVRDSHHYLVPQLFTACFNALVSWLPGGATTANNWRSEAQSFISSL